VVAAPRGHSKSTCLSINFPLQEIVRNCNIRILIVSNALEQSTMFLREIKGRIERDEKYREYAGDLINKYPEKWTDREIIIARTDNDLKDATISTVGTGGSILSRRADLIICDDILNPDNTRTEEQRNKTAQWFFEVLLPVLDPNGRLIFMGTVWHGDDLLSKALTDPSYDFRKKYKAIVSESKHKEMWDEWVKLRYEDKREEANAYIKEHEKEMYEGVEVLWKDRIGYDKLYLLRKENSIAFEKSYQNEIVSSEDSKFKEEWLRNAKELGKNYRLVKTRPDGIIAVTQGVDLAISEKTTADDTVDLTLGKLPDKKFIILNIERGKLSPASTRNLIIEQHKNFKPSQIRVESVAYQQSMVKDMQELNLPVSGYKTGSEKFDEYIGIDTLAVLMENGRLILPYDKSDPHTISLIDQLCDEMRKFPDGHTGDSLMACWFAYTAMRDIGDIKIHII
jgi:hypothetical protein